MNPNIIPLVGAGAGALLGAGLGAGAGLFFSRRRAASVPTPSPAKLKSDARASDALPQAAAPALADAPAPPPSRFNVLGTPTDYLSSGSTALYTPLMRLEERLQWEEESYALGFAIGHLDRLLGMEALMASRTDFCSRAAMPALANEAAARARRLLDDIVKFSHEQMPSPTKREAMEQIVTEIAEAADAIVENITRALAAGPMDMTR